MVLFCYSSVLPSVVFFFFEGWGDFCLLNEDCVLLDLEVLGENVCENVLLCNFFFFFTKMSKRHFLLPITDYFPNILVVCFHFINTDWLNL